ncbi:MAG: SRPBCC domain-containing protein [Gammaproteobacteria bacterium]|nr:SRPBCC domain-containing protein [Gammaproteobacteria bacterium]MDH3371871.1 SRPBCC domain-containing protein [Gammaproteobacteria bacterium]MDH3407800.1 SRPBCC domain-containing protein [Gammaproteobacteria bacterium]MDH3551147.1 SRPBCC domain-containing protein [Gammaproteobacteria bacterium]
MSTHTITLQPVVINAPADIVWDILTDLDGYPEWNPFTVRAESTLEIGSGVDLYIPRGDKLMKQSFVLEIFNPPREVAWRLPKMLHKSVFNAYRTQKVTPIDDHRCSYQTSDTFDGWIAGKLYRSQGGWVLKNFNRLAEALKQRSEARFSGAGDPS